MKLSISRLFELSKFLATDAGQQLEDALQYIADLADNVVRILQNNLTYADNFNCKVATLSLKHNTAQVINTNGKRPYGIQVLQVVSTTTGVDSLIWYVNDSGQVVINVALVGAPTVAADVIVAILFS